MKTYRIVDNGIWIPATQSGIYLFETSKNVIKENSIIIDENINSLVKIKSKLEDERSLSNESKNSDFIELLNDFIKFKYQYCYFLHFTMDFSVNIRELKLASTKSEQLFYTKVIYIDLYRYLEKHNRDLGIINRLSGSSLEYKEYHKSYLRFREKYYREIKENRNLFYAHFDAEVEYDEYFNIAANLDAEIVGKLCICFYETQMKLSSIYLSIDKYFLDRIIDIYNTQKNPSADTGEASETPQRF